MCNTMYSYYILADTHVNHTGVLAGGNYLGSSLAVVLLTFVLSSLYGYQAILTHGPDGHLPGGPWA